MFSIIICVRYSRRISNYLERIPLFDSTQMISIIDLVAIGMETHMIHCKCYFEKKLTKSICKCMYNCQSR